MARQRELVIGASAFVAANVLHSLDHLRQGISGLTPQVLWGGSVLSLAAVVTLVLVLRGSPRAPLAAAAVGAWSAFGVAASHLAPHWSAFSDPYPDLHVDLLSWVVMLAEIAAALLLALLGVRELRRRAPPGGWLSSSTS
jgi:hypothetical protein